MDTAFVIDRFEGDTAVLLGDDGSEHEVQRSLLPPGAREGSVVRVPVSGPLPDWSRAVLDEAELHRRDIAARERLDRLKRRDPGGNIEL